MQIEKSSVNRYARRFVVMTIGVVIMALGIAISKLALLGTTPISTIPAVLSFATPLTIGTWTIIINVIILALEFAILGKKYFDITIVLQMVVAFILGIFTDIWVDIIGASLATDNYIVQWVECAAACVVLSFGVTIAVGARLYVAPGDGIVLAMVKRFGTLEFPKMKIIFDSSNVVIAVILSLALMGELNGVREGTVFAAIAVGSLVGFWRKRILTYIDPVVE